MLQTSRRVRSKKTSKKTVSNDNKTLSLIDKII